MASDVLEALGDIGLDCEIVLQYSSSSWMFLEERSDIVLDSLVDNLTHLIYPITSRRRQCHIKDHSAFRCA